MLTPDAITQFGLIQKVSTGVGWLDCLAVMLLPVLIKHLLPRAIEFARKLLGRAENEPEMVYERQVRPNSGS